MDLPDLHGAATSFFRVLKPGGVAVVLVTHPCFPQSDFSRLRKDGSVHYHWDFSYYDDQELEVPAWKHFTSKFPWYHRPLSRYFQLFKKAGFMIIDFDEPIVPDPPPAEFDETNLKKYRMRPNSVIFLFQKPLNDRYDK